MNKRIIALLLALVLIVSAFAGCALVTGAADGSLALNAAGVLTGFGSAFGQEMTDETLETTEETKTDISPLLFAMMLPVK